MRINDITITAIKECFIVSSKKGEDTIIENRPSYALSFCIDGQITYVHNGKATVSDPSCAVILPQGQTYTLVRDKSGSFPVINFTCGEVLCDTITSLPLQNASMYISQFKKLRSLSLFEGNKAEMMSILYHMFYRLSMESSECKAILPAVTYIENNYRNSDITNAFLADLCSISEVYFRRLFKKQYKISPGQFICDIRIKKAKQLLSEGTLKICAIAEKCGFANQYHFSRMFKSKTGITPSEYMKINKFSEI